MRWATHHGVRKIWFRTKKQCSDSFVITWLSIVWAPIKGEHQQSEIHHISQFSFNKSENANHAARNVNRTYHIKGAPRSVKLIVKSLNKIREIIEADHQTLAGKKNRLKRSLRKSTAKWQKGIDQEVHIWPQWNHSNYVE